MTRWLTAGWLFVALGAVAAGLGPLNPAQHAVNGFMPTQVQYCQLWVDANRICMKAGQLVDNWEDFSLIANTPFSVSGTVRPVVSVVNGRPCLKFDGTNDYMVMGSLTLTTDMILYAVLKDGPSRFFFEHSTSVDLNDGFAFTGGTPPWKVRRTSLRGVNATDGWAGTNAFCVVSFSYNVATTNGVVKRNGVTQSYVDLVGAGVPANTAVSASLYINSRAGSEFFSDSSIAEMVIVTNTIKTAVDQSMVRYLGVKYGIVVP